MLNINAVSSTPSRRKWARGSRPSRPPCRARNWRSPRAATARRRLPHVLRPCRPPWPRPPPSPAPANERKIRRNASVCSARRNRRSASSSPSSSSSSSSFLWCCLGSLLIIDPSVARRVLKVSVWLTGSSWYCTNSNRKSVKLNESWKTNHERSSYSIQRCLIPNSLSLPPSLSSSSSRSVTPACKLRAKTLHSVPINRPVWLRATATTLHPCPLFPEQQKSKWRKKWALQMLQAAAVIKTKPEFAAEQQHDVEDTDSNSRLCVFYLPLCFLVISASRWLLWIVFAPTCCRFCWFLREVEGSSCQGPSSVLYPSVVGKTETTVG